ncbi:MAG: tRNA (N(6)-L-threonylcarbamoyladenosine(37)-C(2))-methylthiotransferase MtaB [Planctomycetota bacterium]|nr:MAG: tRNA (N(6)-L-threonylcarbamoyladenosine(37)-C(2))-methylthiotransferase MtaB [Planctomycetota bacterium]
MQKFVVKTLGCKVNQYEGQQIRQLLERLGLSVAEPADRADLVVVNTCCVTHTASAKSRQYLHKAQKQHPNATFVLAGCLPVGQSSELKLIKGPVHIISNKKDLAKTLVNLLPDNCSATCAPHTKELTVYSTSKRTLMSGQLKSPKTCQPNSLPAKIQPAQHDRHKLGILTSYAGRCRALLKIQDGCDGYCAYCIVPKIRNRLYSKPISIVLQEAYNLVYAGHKEIVLTGIFLGAYGQSSVIRSRWNPDRKDMLAQLVDKIAQIPGLERIRLSSLEPADVTDRLLEVFCKRRNVMPHLHLPLQSGSERILRKMRRQYTVAQFLQVVDRVKLSSDRPAITTDIIVGFPGETDDDFHQTIKVANTVGFSKIHVFSFSPRPGTAAAKMQPAVKPEVIKERSAILRNLDKKLQAKFQKQFVGEKVGIIVENTRPLRGRTERYFMVELGENDNEQPLEPGQLVWRYLR